MKVCVKEFAAFIRRLDCKGWQAYKGRMGNIKITVRVPQEQLALLDEMKTRVGRPREESIRRAIERYLRSAKMFHGKHDGETRGGNHDAERTRQS